MVKLGVLQAPEGPLSGIEVSGKLTSTKHETTYFTGSVRVINPALCPNAESTRSFRKTFPGGNINRMRKGDIRYLEWVAGEGFEEGKSR
jgi:hypothetical protein